ncbi:MAG: (d)CMP kinase [Pseudomonadota bacterium]|nr:(d)CMP kinase [Pseudomonadota bacterium]
MIIAIDGPAASGKGTLGKRVAAHYGFHHLDTGLLYRAVALALLDRGHPLEDAAAATVAARRLEVAALDEVRLRRRGLAEAASVVSAHTEVRAALLELQRAFARRPPGAVLDGRDIGTIVCPDADVKLFVTATAEERARRRALELRAAGLDVDEAAILADIRRRDERDSNRPVAPLRPAPDAILLDTTNLDIDAAFRAAIDLIGRARS